MLIDPTVHKLIREFEIPASLPFGEYKVPVMYTASYRDSQWLEGTLGPYHSLSIDPAAKCLHYAVEAFEGMKAFGRGPDRPVIFRPDSNWQRLNRSLARIAAPEVPREMFFDFCHHVCGCQCNSHRPWSVPLPETLCNIH